MPQLKALLNEFKDVFKLSTGVIRGHKSPLYFKHCAISNQQSVASAVRLLSAVQN